jgi:heat shock 70kDa protein 1/2/6/8
MIFFLLVCCVGLLICLVFGFVGTTYSCVAVLRDASTGVEVLANEFGNRTMPSYVAFTESERLVGEAAKNQAAMNPTNTIFDAKRLIGRCFSDLSVQNDMRTWPFKVINDGKDQPQIEVQHNNETKRFYPQQISAMVLGKMKQVAETSLGMPIKNAVITVPAYFNNQQRDCTRDAAIIAGLNPLRILSEPTSASMAYGLDPTRHAELKKKERTVLVFDLGGGTFDVSIVCIDDDVYEVKAVGGNTHLGGCDLDNRMLEYFIKEFKLKYKKDLSTSDRAKRRLLTACERAKRQLSAAVTASVEIDSLFEGHDFSTTISRARFEELNIDYFQECLRTVEKVMSDAKMSKQDIEEVAFVGGSTRIPKIKEMVRDFFGKEPNSSINADEAVAVGAAIQAAIITGQVSMTGLIIDVAPLSLGIETAGGVMTKIIERNSQIPSKKSQVFSTYADFQEAVVIQIYEGERALTKHNRKLGRFDLTGIQRAPRGVPQIEVSFDLDCNGILKVSAVDKASKKQEQLEIKNDTGKLSKDQIEQMLRDSDKFKAEDEVAMKRVEALQKLESLAYGLRDTLKDVEEKKNQHKMGGNAAIDSLKKHVQETLQWLATNTGSSGGNTASVEDIELKFKQLDDAAKPIVAKLYDQANPNNQSTPMHDDPHPAATCHSTSGGPKVEEVD